MTKLKSLEILHQNTNKDSNTSLHDILTNLSGGKLGSLLVKKSDDDYDIGWNEELVSELSDALAKIEYLVELRTTDKEAFAKEVKTLTAKFDAGQAQIIEELLVQASQDEVLAKKISSLSSELGGNMASITQTMSTLVTEQTATATLTTEIQARLDTGDFAAVKEESSATADRVDGVEAKWGVTVNANGNVAGIQLLNGTNTQSSFIVDATKFIVKKPDSTNGIEWNGATSVLKISGDVYANGFYGNVVGTDNLTANSVSKVAYNSSTSTITGTGSPQTLIGVSIANSSGVDMPIIGLFTGRSSYSSGTRTVAYRVQGIASGTLEFGTLTAYADFPSFQFVDTIPANTTRTYYIEWTAQDSTLTSIARYLTIFGLKR